MIPHDIPGQFVSKLEGLDQSLMLKRRQGALGSKFDGISQATQGKGEVMRRYCQRIS